MNYSLEIAIYFGEIANYFGEIADYLGEMADYFGEIALCFVGRVDHFREIAMRVSILFSRLRCHFSCPEAISGSLCLCMNVFIEAALR